MSNHKDKQLEMCLSCHAWNKDASKLAWSDNTNNLYIGTPDGKKEHTLSEHDQFITGVDWAPKSNRIVTSSQDRNAYVWCFDEALKKWMPTLVILRINRAATDVKWSPNEDKFAVSSGAKCVSVCYFEEENDWWVSKHIKKPIKSTVLCLNWHPNNVLVATGSADFKCRIFSAFVKGVDKKGTGVSEWGSKLNFGELLCEIECGGGWVHGVNFTPSGGCLGFVSHTSQIGFVQPTEGGEPYVELQKTRDLPLKKITFLNEYNAVVAGYDNQPYLYTWKEDKFVLVGSLDQKKKAAGPTKSGTSAAFAKFQDATTKGAASGSNLLETKLETTHQNAINCIAVMKYDSNWNVTQFSTSGYDGKLVIWDVKGIEQQFAGLKIF